MISYTCDLCGKPMIEEDPLRFVVKIELFAAKDPLECCDDDWIDDRRADAEHLPDFDDVAYRSFRYDLCNECRAEYLKDPLFRRALRRGPRHSDN